MIDPAYLDTLGVFQDHDGRYKRYRIRARNFEYDPTDPKAELNGNLIGYDEELIPYPVVLPLATDPDSIEEARLKAAASHADFYHPKWGWLRWGIKPEKDHAENLGSAATPNRRRRVTLSSAAPRTEPDTQPEPEPEPEPETSIPAADPQRERERPDRVPAPPPTSKGR